MWHFSAAIAITLIIIGALAIAYFYESSSDKRQKTPATQVQNHQTGLFKTFRNRLFQFKDTSNWVLDKEKTTSNRYVYNRYRGLIIEHQLIIYIDHTPDTVDVLATRAFPVRIVNNNSFDATGVSTPCVKFYDSYNPQDIKEINVNGALIICDPKSAAYTVIVSEIGGDYKLNLKRSNQSNVQLIITYRDLTANSQPYTIKNIVANFQVL